MDLLKVYLPTLNLATNTCGKARDKVIRSLGNARAAEVDPHDEFCLECGILLLVLEAYDAIADEQDEEEDKTNIHNDVTIKALTKIF